MLQLVWYARNLLGYARNLLQVELTDKGSLRAGLACSIDSIVGRVEGCLW